MRLSKLVGERVKVNPASATVKSQAILMRAGYIKQVSNGIYSMLTPAQKVSFKIQNIIREEMNKIDGQEVILAKIEYGQTAGYRVTDLVYAGDLIANIGESITSVLDKIKNMLVEFEYFYNVHG